MEPRSLRCKIAVRYNADIVTPSHFLHQSRDLGDVQVRKQHESGYWVRILIYNSLHLRFMFQYVVNPAISSRPDLQQPLNSTSLHALYIRLNEFFVYFGSLSNHMSLLFLMFADMDVRGRENDRGLHFWLS